MISGSLSARSLSIGYLRRGGLDIPVPDLMVDAGNLVVEYREIMILFIQNYFSVSFYFSGHSPSELGMPKEKGSEPTAGCCIPRYYRKAPGMEERWSCAAGLTLIGQLCSV